MNRNTAQPQPRMGALLTSPYLLLIGATLFWAGNFVIGRALRGDIPPVTLNFWRWVLALIILLPLSLGHMRRHRVLIMAEWKLVVALGATGVAAFHTLVYQALTTTTALNALLFVSTAPMLIVLVSWVMFRDTITVRQGIGILASLLGAVVVIARGDMAFLLNLRFNTGDLLMLVAVSSWALYSVLLKRRPPELPPLALLTASVIAGVLLLLPVYLWRLAEGEIMLLTTPNVISLLYITVFAAVVAFICWNTGVAAIGPNAAGLFIHLMPLFGAVLSVLFLGEHIAAFHVIGAALVFSGIALASQWRHRRLWRRQVTVPEQGGV